jgi:hypothetical protein
MLTLVLRTPGSGARAAAAAALAAVAVLTAGGCAGFSKAFGQQEAVVQFRPGTPKSTRLQVRSACSRIPQVKPEPLPSASLPSAQLYDVRYEVGGASDAHLAQLQQCLQRFPSVVGVDFQAPGD